MTVTRTPIPQVVDKYLAATRTQGHTVEQYREDFIAFGGGLRGVEEATDLLPETAAYSTALFHALRDAIVAEVKSRPAPAQATNRHPVTPTRPSTGRVSPQVPDGRYAVGSPLRFYRVNTPTEGKWAGYTFVEVFASDERHPIRNRAERTRILAEIAHDPEAASLRYGREIGECGRCGRTLTDEGSRAAGIGPDCAKKGW